MPTSIFSAFEILVCSAWILKLPYMNINAITNIAAARIKSLSKIRLSANWMAAAGHEGEDANLFDTVKTVAEDMCWPDQGWGLLIPK